MVRSERFSVYGDRRINPDKGFWCGVEHLTFTHKNFRGDCQ
ncbi:hypothetical protein IMCC3088_1645 [Aequoribacter fuscus]|uniref:Uncharacterized protein n=1 Tax=Aequoribacter fuscus TaxID=2518989 RepID=F3L278_9GAMM|nr:hypothetical protein IMCC3088_1645 [Aequoribacter fuscus]